MSRISERLGWVPPLLVGACAAIAAEVALGILLYGGPGLARSLTTVLGVEGTAFAAGLWSAPSPGPELVERLRKWWLFCLATFMGAAIFGTSWSVVQDLGGGRVGQGLGLAVLAGLPLYACGAVIGGMGSVGASEPASVSRGRGASVAFGAGLGFVMTGVLLPRAPVPASLLVACLVLLSAAGMVYGVVLGARPQVEIRASKPSAGVEVRVEDRRPGPVDPTTRYLFEGEHVRRRASLNEEPVVPWDVAVAKAMLPAGDDPWRTLVIGGGASALPRTILGEHPSATVEVLERNEAVLELARDHFDTGASDDGSRVRVRVGNIEDLLADLSGPYDLVLVDTAALAPLGGVAGLSRAATSALYAALEGRGAVVWGPVGSEAPAGEPADAWRHTVLRRARGEVEEVLVVSVRAESEPRTPGIDGFVAMGGPPEQ
jgi:hypothetical protein